MDYREKAFELATDWRSGLNDEIRNSVQVGYLAETIEAALREAAQAGKDEGLKMAANIVSLKTEGNT